MQEPLLLHTGNSGHLPQSRSILPHLGLPSVPSPETVKNALMSAWDFFLKYSNIIGVTALDGFGEFCDGVFTFCAFARYLKSLPGEPTDIDSDVINGFILAMLLSSPMVIASYRKMKANKRRSGYVPIDSDNPLNPAKEISLLAKIFEAIAIASPIGIMTFGAADLGWGLLLSLSMNEDSVAYEVLTLTLAIATALSLASRRYHLNYYHAHPPQGKHEHQGHDDGASAWQRYKELKAQGKRPKAIYYATSIIVGHFIEAFFECSAGFMIISMPQVARFVLGLIFSLPIVIYVSNTELRSIFGELLSNEEETDEERNQWQAMKDILRSVFLGLASGPHMVMPMMGFIMLLNTVVCGISSRGENLSPECASSSLYWPLVVKGLLLSFAMVVFGWAGGKGFKETVGDDLKSVCGGEEKQVDNLGPNESSDFNSEACSETSSVTDEIPLNTSPLSKEPHSIIQPYPLLVGRYVSLSTSRYNTWNESQEYRHKIDALIIQRPTNA